MPSTILGFLAEQAVALGLVAEPGFFMELSAVIIAAVILGIIFRKLKQPTILAFIVTGVLLGSTFFDVISFTDMVLVFSDLGIAFLLFLVGINLDPKVLKDIGRTSIITGLGQIAFTFTIGFVVGTMVFGFSFIESTYIALALTFSSTIIVVKLLTDKHDLNSLYAKISIGFLLVQDFVAILALIFISTMRTQAVLSQQIFVFIFKLALLAIVVWIVSKYLIKRIFDSLARSQDLLFLGGISWCFALASLSMILIQSKEIGAFIAGVSIASLPYSYEVFAKLRYLRDFFIVLFFVYLGLSLPFTSSAVLVPALVFSFIVLVGNPLIIFILMTFLGYKGRTSFLTASGFAQISEFSLIVILLGEEVGQLSGELTSMVTLVAVITISISTYFILYNNRIYEKLFKHIPILNKPRFWEDELSSAKSKPYPLILLGFGETGQKLFRSLKTAKEDVLLVDYDPRVIKRCMKDNFHCIYGDVADLETIKYIMRKKPHIIVSTVMDPETNERLVREFNKKKKTDRHLIILASTVGEARELYEKKADIVLVPSQIAAEKIGIVISDLKEHKHLELDFLKRKYSDEFTI